MGKRDDQVEPMVEAHHKWRIQEGGARKACCQFPGKQKTKVIGHCLRRENNHICATRGFWETEQRSTEQVMEG